MYGSFFNSNLLTSIVTSFLFFFTGFSQVEIKTDSTFSVRYQYAYHYKNDHHGLVLTYNYKKNQFYLGPEFSSFYEALGDPVDLYEKQAFGLGLGYRYQFLPFEKRLNFYFQYHFSMYQYKTTEVQLGPPYQTAHSYFKVENMASLGLSYKLFTMVQLHVGAGFGSYNAFIFFIDRFNPFGQVGVSFLIN